MTAMLPPDHIEQEPFPNTLVTLRQRPQFRDPGNRESHPLTADAATRPRAAPASAQPTTPEQAEPSLRRSEAPRAKIRVRNIENPPRHRPSRPR
ncbi:hypothetical protein GCM10010321_51580 [Streptomyces chartreusis]|nr:hypothetical protein GCM10010321_51580 [Streptomyces chartreusis]